MGTRRLIGAGTGALLLAAMLAVPTADVASAASLSTNRAASASSTSSATSVSHYRLVRSAQMRRLGSASTAATLKAVTKAVRTSEFTEGVPAADYTVTGLTVSGSWAKVVLRPKSPNQLDEATAVLQKSRGVWKVVDLGTAEVGCELPAATIKALRLSCS